jgi:hypothetical protein
MIRKGKLVLAYLALSNARERDRMYQKEKTTIINPEQLLDEVWLDCKQRRETVHLYKVIHVQRDVYSMCAAKLTTTTHEL